MNRILSRQLRESLFDVGVLIAARSRAATLRDGSEQRPPSERGAVGESSVLVR